MRINKKNLGKDKSLSFLLIFWDKENVFFLLILWDGGSTLYLYWVEKTLLFFLNAILFAIKNWFIESVNISRIQRLFNYKFQTEYQSHLSKLRYSHKL